ncbi:MAG: hypothetical protein JNJ57_12085 [Saprospiraceae bacterium]|nr:hypothetical protein [Saprospiraceae bacterium]
MKTDNERLKVILHNARLVCISKFQMVQSNFGAANADLIGINQKMDDIMGKFNNPSFWATPIPFEETDITQRMLMVDICPPNDLPGFKKGMNDFVDYLDKKILNGAAATGNLETLISDANLKVLNALTACQRNVAGRKIFFRNQGVDLDKTPDFLNRQQKQTPVMAEYRRVLNENEVQATDSDEIVFKAIADGIKSSTVLVQFYQFYDMLTATMKSKLPPGNPLAV